MRSLCRFMLCEASGKYKEMSFEFIRKLPTPDEIRKEYPLPENLARLKEERDRQIRDVITGKSKKFLVIIGPCSAAVSYTHLDVYKRQAQ